MAKWNQQLKLQKIDNKEYGCQANQYMALLDHRNTPTQGLTTTSPVQRFTNRRTRTIIPTTAKLLKQGVIK